MRQLATHYPNALRLARLCCLLPAARLCPSFATLRHPCVASRMPEEHLRELARNFPLTKRVRLLVLFYLASRRDFCQTRSA